MAQLYRHLFEKKILAQRLKLPKQATTAQIVDASAAFITRHAPDNSPIILYRLPKAELSFLAAQPCFVEAADESGSIDFN